MKKLLSLAVIAVLSFSLMACGGNSSELSVTAVRNQRRESSEFNYAELKVTVAKGKFVTGDKVTIQREGSKQDTYTIEDIYNADENKTLDSVSSSDKIENLLIVISDKGLNTASDYNKLNVKENDKIVK